MLDLTEEFYLETIDVVFQRYLLPKGELVHAGRQVDLAAHHRRGADDASRASDDDISGVGQTQAAHALCANIPQAMRELYVQPGVGHYGVFNGRRFVRGDLPPHPRLHRQARSAHAGSPGACPRGIRGR